MKPVRSITQFKQADIVSVKTVAYIHHSHHNTPWNWYIQPWALHYRSRLSLRLEEGCSSPGMLS